MAWQCRHQATFSAAVCHLARRDGGTPHGATCQVPPSRPTSQHAASRKRSGKRKQEPLTYRVSYATCQSASKHSLIDPPSVSQSVKHPSRRDERTNRSAIAPLPARLFGPPSIHPSHECPYGYASIHRSNACKKRTPLSTRDDPAR